METFDDRSQQARRAVLAALRQRGQARDCEGCFVVGTGHGEEKVRLDAEPWGRSGAFRLKLHGEKLAHVGPSASLTEAQAGAVADRLVAFATARAARRAAAREADRAAIDASSSWRGRLREAGYEPAAQGALPLPEGRPAASLELTPAGDAGLAVSFTSEQWPLLRQVLDVLAGRTG